MSQSNPFPETVYLMIRADGRSRFMMTNRPWTLPLGEHGGPSEVVSCCPVPTYLLAPEAVVVLLAALAFDALTMTRPGGRVDFVSWVVDPSVRVFLIDQAARESLAHHVVECTEFTVLDDEEPTVALPRPARRFQTLSMGAP